MKVYILMGNPNKEGTFSNELATLYEEGAKAAGHEVRKTNISDLKFDPILHKGYREIQELEPDLKQFQEDVRWCDHFVLVYPLWWSSAPSLLKGLIDRTWLPAFAFRFIKGPDGKSTMGWQKLLKGKTARVIVTLKNWPIVERFMFGDYTAEIVSAVLQFAGFKVRLTEIGNAEDMSAQTRKRWGDSVSRLGRNAR
jgi:NAD(P)H dehydrogenase (quinone)